MYDKCAKCKHSYREYSSYDNDVKLLCKIHSKFNIGTIGFVPAMWERKHGNCGKDAKLFVQILDIKKSQELDEQEEKPKRADGVYTPGGDLLYRL